MDKITEQEQAKKVTEEGGKLSLDTLEVNGGTTLFVPLSSPAFVICLSLQIVRLTSMIIRKA